MQVADRVQLYKFGSVLLCAPKQCKMRVEQCKGCELWLLVLGIFCNCMEIDPDLP